MELVGRWELVRLLNGKGKRVRDESLYFASKLAKFLNLLSANKFTSKAKNDQSVYMRNRS
jgi:hypothetical protein